MIPVTQNDLQIYKRRTSRYMDQTCKQFTKETQMASKHVKLCSAAKSLQSCPTLCDPMDGSPPGSPIPGILQARTLEWVAISFSSA